MKNTIRVHTVMYTGCKCWSLRYKDPVTGKQRRKNSNTTSRPEARNLARDWEAELNSGRDPGRCITTWAQFRLTYECQEVPSLAPRTGRKINTVFNAVERILPKVANGKMSDLTPQAISVLQAELRASKLSETTIGAYLAHLHSALVWAAEQEMIPAAPKIKRPTRAKKRGRASKAKGRNIMAEEFERMLSKVPAAILADRKRRRESQRNGRGKPWAEGRPVTIQPAQVESWRHYMTGLWLSGLRLEESLALSWDEGSPFQVDLTGKRPRFQISAEAEKGNSDRVLPLTPDFAKWLFETTPAEDRHGFVFHPETLTGRASYDAAGRILSLTGELAGVKVHTSPQTGKVKFASAHDLRRCFGTRWAKRKMPAVLQLLMRHESIDTTMKYYVDLDADDLAEDLWADYDGKELGTVSGTLGQEAIYPKVQKETQAVVS